MIEILWSLLVNKIDSVIATVCFIVCNNLNQMNNIKAVLKFIPMVTALCHFVVHVFSISNSLDSEMDYRGLALQGSHEC